MFLKSKSSHKLRRQNFEELHDLNGYQPPLEGTHFRTERSSNFSVALTTFNGAENALVSRSAAQTSRLGRICGI